jgi:flavin reductase (DIM6/NTAB) family NADH-FMN oxidoreductase RutF
MSTEITPGRFRHVFGHLPTGVSILTALTPAGPTGMAANSVTSVSLDPPLILCCPAKSSSTWPSIRHVGRFCVNVMAGQHAEIARRFAQRDIDRFDGVAWDPRPGGPALRGAVAWIDCNIEQEHSAGDHTIVVARVTRMDLSDGGDPLVFFRGGYGTFRASEA